ncbi:hypothetical protein [uncultured Thiocystis sp.]|jgi:hypothetical protein|uniref:hypothetical protein n=1 Tax=uncultured Thiocystis sp. TaxID=1202134 RepID=UPI0025F5626C|nr:hypothetical protein [uncultured Thiocystis sp.]
MPSLREKLAEHGFESNDDYEFQLRCLLESPTRGVRTLNIEGDGERRKTAFATALAHALDYPHVLYHDFTDEHPPLPEIILPPSRDELGREEPPIAPLDQIVSEACAQSEGEPTVLILDQLHAADFREHIRVHRLVRSGVWTVLEGRYFANPRHLLLFLISEEPLYHSLQKESFRIWIGRVSERQVRYCPSDFGLDPSAQPLFDAFADLFRVLGTAPTRSEFTHLLRDLRLHARSVEHLQLSLYGRTEGLDRQALAASSLAGELAKVMDAAQTMWAAASIASGAETSFTGSDD